MNTPLGFTTMITILRAPRRESKYQSTGTPDWDNPHRTACPIPVSIQPLAASEGAPDRPSTTTQWELITRPGHVLDLRASDRVEPAGLTTDSGEPLVLSVVGRVAVWPHPTQVGQHHHVEAVLEEVHG